MKRDDIDDVDPIVDGRGGYFVGFWFLAAKNGDDFMATLHRPAGATELQLDYRFRRRVDDKIFDSDDTKSSYEVDFTGKTEDESIAIVDRIIAELVNAGYVGSRLPWLIKKRSWRRIVRGDERAFWLAIKDLPFVHMTRPGHLTTPERKKGEGN